MYNLFINIINDFNTRNILSFNNIHWKVDIGGFDKALELLKDSGINYRDVFRMLERRYKPEVRNEYKEISFQNSKCIQKRMGNIIEFNNSEPHKLITDIYYCDEKIEFEKKLGIIYLTLIIKNLKVNKLEIPWYSEILKNNKLKVNNNWIKIKKELLEKHTLKDLQNLNFNSTMKKRSFRRKMLRYYLYTKQIDLMEFKRIVKI